MNPTDIQICRDVITALRSDKYKNTNYLFQEPVDIKIFPTYAQLVKQPMDLGTAAKNLENNMYNIKQKFFADVALCFDNTKEFHKNNPDNAWIILMGDQMKKFLDKERKRAEKKHGGGGESGKKPKLKLSLKHKGSGKKNPKATASSHLPKSATLGGAEAEAGAVAVAVAVTKSASSTSTSKHSKIKLSLKIKPAAAPSVAALARGSAPEQELQSSTGPTPAFVAVSSNVQTPAATKSKKPKLKLKLSSKKSAPAAPIDTPSSKITTAATATPKASATTVSRKSSSKKEPAKKSSSTPKSMASGSSRGKELPAAVAEKKAAKKAESKKAASAKKAAAVSALPKTPVPKTPSLKISTKPKIPALKISSTTKPKIPALKISSTTKPKTPALKISSTKTISGKTSSGQIKIKMKNSSSSILSPKKMKLTLGGPGKIQIGDGAMNPNIKAQCYKVISALKRKEHLEIKWFLKPVYDPMVIDDYKAKIKNPMDLATLASKLDKNTHTHVSEFASDLRHIFGNCLLFNALAGDSFRPVAQSMANTSEDLMHLLIQQHSAKPIYPKLLYCWKMCLQIIDKALELKNLDDGYPTIHYFLHPVSFFFGGGFPPEYFEKVQTPMDFGTITSKLMDGTYQSVDSFVLDCRLVTTNCKAFYMGKPEGAVFVGQATRLEEFLSQHIEVIGRYDSSQQGSVAKSSVPNPPVVDLVKPRKDFLTSLIAFLRDLTYTDSTTKLTEPASILFERPVDVTMFSDYLKYVKVPMDIATVEMNVGKGAYVYAEDFEHDVNLIFKNCEAYNIPKGHRHIVKLAKFCAKSFRKQYSSRIKAFDASGGVSFVVEDKKDKKRMLNIAGPSSAVSPPSKKARKSPVNVPIVAKPKAPKKALPRIIIRTDGPLPLHVAIAKIKQEFSIRRPHKDLDFWEDACSRFFRELKKHPWISSSKRFVFDAPVPLLHPEIKQAYAAKIRDPMDLTTAECKLLQGGLYQGPQEFVDDIARVFANAVTFNQSGHEEGDPTSCAYYDASRHLLRYARWLSLETISPFLVDDSQSEGSKQAGPIPQWNLSTSNQKDAREEMEEIAMKQPMDRSDEGDRFTWMEGECEKLLKSLRHQSDNKRMCYFLQPNYPADYFAYISRPMDWETCYRRLQDRKYETFGEIAGDLRQIFSNALKYNGRMKDMDPISKQAYDSAVTMSEKLEVTIQRMLITVSDRVERDKVEQVVIDREMEISHKEEEERVKKEWQQERERGGPSASEPHRATSSITKVVRRPNVRKGMDFDFPFYDEEGTHEQSAVEVISIQKKMYEEQQLERVRMDANTQYLGYAVHHKLQERSCAIHWAKQLTQKIQLSLSHKNTVVNGKGSSEDNEKINNGLMNNVHASFVASLLENSSRSQIKLALSTGGKKKKKKRKTRLFLD